MGAAMSEEPENFERIPQKLTDFCDKNALQIIDGAISCCSNDSVRAESAPALLRKIDSKVGGLRGEVSAMREVMATKNDIANVRSEMKSLRADVASDLMSLEKRIGEQEKRLSDQIGLRRSVMKYHSSAIGP
jgi:hypothetical protein